MWWRCGRGPPAIALPLYRGPRLGAGARANGPRVRSPLPPGGASHRGRLPRLLPRSVPVQGAASHSGLSWLAALAAYPLLRRRGAHFRSARDEAFLLLPVAFFLVYFDVFFRAQIGIRFLLVAFPLLHVFAGYMLSPAVWAALGRRARRGLSVVGGFLGLWLVTSVLSWYPDFLPYMNELLADRKLAYRVLADSNLDWGQNREAIDRYRTTHPEVLWQPERPSRRTHPRRRELADRRLRRRRFLVDGWVRADRPFTLLALDLRGLGGGGREGASRKTGSIRRPSSSPRTYRARGADACPCGTPKPLLELHALSMPLALAANPPNQL